MKIIVGADAWGVELKDTVKQHLAKHGHEVTDIGGTPGNQRPYYDVAKEAARMLQAGAAERAVLVCGTGMGMAIVANKFKGVYASVIESEFTRACAARSATNVDHGQHGGRAVRGDSGRRRSSTKAQGLEVADFLHRPGRRRANRAGSWSPGDAQNRARSKLEIWRKWSGRGGVRTSSAHTPYHQDLPSKFAVCGDS